MPVRDYDQKQMFLFPYCLDEWVTGDHQARAFSEIVDQIDVRSLRTIKTEGRPCFHPRMLLKVILWAYAHGIRASRKIEEQLHSNVIFLWLAGLEKPDYRTICYFRRSNEEALKQIFKQVLLVARGMGLLQLELVATDGTKVKASAGIDSFHSVAEWREELARIQKEVEAAMTEAEAQDCADDRALGPEIGTVKVPVELAKQEQRIAQIKDLLQHIKYDGNEAILVSSTDPEARFMHGAHASVPGFNAQVSVTRGQIIVHAGITNEPIDTNQLVPALEGIKENTGEYPKAALADTGFNSGPNLAAMEARQVDGYVPEKNERNIGKGQPVNTEFYRKEDFRYDAEQDCYHCPAGQVLKPTGEIHTRTKYSKHDAIRYRTALGTCLKCPLKDRCTKTKNPLGRSITRDDYEAERTRMRQKLVTEAGKRTYGQRKCLVEPTIGQLKMVGGFQYFLLRGLAGAWTELQWVAMAHNVLKLMRRTVERRASAA